MHKSKNILIIVLSLFLVINAGCGRSEGQVLLDKSEEKEIVESSVKDILEQSLEKENIEQLQTRSSEEEVSEETFSEEVKIEVPKVEIDYNNLIDERKALDLAYNYLYEDSLYSGYSVYSDEIYHQGILRWGYVIVQFAYDDDSTIPKYEKYDPNAELKIGTAGRIELLYDGLSPNELFYTFWICEYIQDDEEWGHRSTYDFVAVSIDGRMVVCQRSDEDGNDKSIEEWDWYDDLISQK